MNSYLGPTIRYDIDRQPRAQLDTLVDSMGVADAVRIAIEGHTDDNPVANTRFASNWELSAARATNVVRLFGDAQVPLHRMRAVAFADTQPKVANRDAAGQPVPANQAQNRRIIIRVHL